MAGPPMKGLSTEATVACSAAGSSCWPAAPPDHLYTPLTLHLFPVTASRTVFAAPGRYCVVRHCSSLAALQVQVCRTACTAPTCRPTASMPSFFSASTAAAITSARRPVMATRAP